ncbi:REP-associated tyrosine transposase [Luteimonas salinilitoris]|uniref:Transposase n=1 Tax=Luteimonas salinilitoris TaxID=3237697 RepID=A0ABV4HWY3_9GAMM
MPNYRRLHLPGRTWFFTVNLLERRRRLLVEHVDVLRHAFAEARKAKPFQLLAVVVLPDHLHCLWRLPEGDADNAGRWSRIKAGFSRRLPPDEWRNRSRIAKRERGIWQRRFWARLILDEHDLHRHVDYIHFNPVKHGHAPRAADWPHSSIHAYIARGWLPADWGGDAFVEADGERRRTRACGGPRPTL